MAYAPPPSRGASFALAFANGIKEGIDERSARRDQLLDTSIDSAKRKVSTYAKAQNQLKSVLDIGDRLKAEYNITDAEFVALTQEGDISKTYEAIINEAANRRNLFGESGFNRTTFKNEFMSAYSIPKDFLPDGPNARENAVRTILGMNTSNLQNEVNPKSESGADNSFRKTLANFFVTNPKLSAEQALDGMQVMGYDVNSLIGYTGVGQDVDDRIKREREVLFDNIDYDQNSSDQTQRKYQSLLSTRLTNIDQGDETISALNMSVMQLEKSGATEKAAALAAKRSSAMSGSRALAKLERQLIVGGRDLGLGFVGSAGRRNIIDGIFDSIDTADGASQIQTLIDRVNNDGQALAYIKKAWEASDGIIPQEVFDNLLNKDFDLDTGNTKEAALDTEATTGNEATTTDIVAAQKAANEAKAAQKDSDDAKAALKAAGIGADVDALKVAAEEAAKRAQEAADKAAKRAEEAAVEKEDEVETGEVPDFINSAPQVVQDMWTPEAQKIYDGLTEEGKKKYEDLFAAGLGTTAINELNKEEEVIIEVDEEEEDEVEEDNSEEVKPTRRKTTFQEDLETFSDVASTITEKVTGGISALAAKITTFNDDAKTSFEHKNTLKRVGPPIFKWLINSGLTYDATLPEIKEQVDGWINRNDPNNLIPEGFSSDKKILDILSKALMNPGALLKR